MGTPWPQHPDSETTESDSGELRTNNIAQPSETFKLTLEAKQGNFSYVCFAGADADSDADADDQ